MDDIELLESVRVIARGMGVVDVSVASADSWETDGLVSGIVGEGHRPKDIMPDARSVIVIGVPVQRTIVDTAPSIYYNHLYGVVNALLDQVSERIALELNIRGHRAIYVPRDGYHGIAGLRDIPKSFFSHRHAAYLAGMGTFGWNNMVLTERYGPRIRFSSVITSAELPSSEPLGRELCVRCGRCTRECPASAVADGDYPDHITLKTLCVDKSAELAQVGRSPCGRCIAVCPVGADRGPSPTDKAVETIRRYGKPPKQ